MLSLTELNRDELVPMNEEQSKMLMTATIGEMQNSITSDMLETDFMCKVIKARLAIYNENVFDVVTPSVLAMLSVLSEGRPGNGVLWAYTLKELHKAGGFRIDMNQLTRAFASGFPSGAGYERAWDAQKDPGAPLGNLLDTQGAWV